MTFFAGHRRMDADEGKVRDVVLETYLLAPARGSMAAFAPIALFSVV